MHAPLPSASRVSFTGDGAVEGYASLFGEVDQARDMVMPGAFTQTLRHRGLRRIPMLFQHDPSEPVGIWLELREDMRGLWARGRLIPEVARGRELMALVGETDSRAQTTSPTLDALSFPVMELYAMPAATATLLDDAAVNIDDWIASEVELTFAVQEGAAFVSGDGSSKPKGFLQYDTVANASWAWGKLGYVASGNAGAFPASNPSDVLVDTIYALKAGYRQNGSFVMNRKTQAAIRKFKDSGGAYLWQPPAQAGGRASLMTFPLVEAEDMPDIAANSLSIAFGDFRRGYLIVDRLGVRVLRDPYSAKPYVLFYTTKRVGGGVQDFDAIKLVKFAAS